MLRWIGFDCIDLQSGHGGGASLLVFRKIELWLIKVFLELRSVVNFLVLRPVLIDDLSLVLSAWWIGERHIFPSWWRSIEQQLNTGDLLKNFVSKKLVSSKNYVSQKKLLLTSIASAI